MGHVDWERRRLQVYSPKTDSTRFVPIVPELHDILAAAYDAAPERATKIISMSTNNLRRGLEGIVAKAGLRPWDDLWQTLRRSAETMFSMTYPQHAVSQWIGHSVQVSLKHYTMTPETLFETVASAPVLRAAVGSGIGSQGAANGSADTEQRSATGNEPRTKFKKW